MSSNDLDISDLLTWEDGLPRPQWDLIATLIKSADDSVNQRFAWTAIVRQWLAELGPALGSEYEIIESEHFLILSAEASEIGHPLLGLAERCKKALESTLHGVASFQGDGKHPVVALRNTDDYYRYISLYYPEGKHGGSGGLHIREGYPHVALQAKPLWPSENALAHELTHVSLHHLSMPQWLEEGLAQMFEHAVTGRSVLQVDARMAERHKRYWGIHGLDDFWYGTGFSRSGKVSELSYQLAEILVRLLVEEGKPRWFGWVREPQRRFFAFLRQAREQDCGETACQEQLGFGLGDLASRFLGSDLGSPT